MVSLVDGMYGSRPLSEKYGRYLLILRNSRIHLSSEENRVESGHDTQFAVWRSRGEAFR